MPPKSLRAAFLDAFFKSEKTLLEIAIGSGVPRRNLENLVQNPNAMLDVEDAQRVAAYFGSSLENLLQAPELKHHVDIAQLYNRLPDHLKARFLDDGPEPPEGSDPSDPE